MAKLLTRCGYRCDLCLAYRPNVEAHPENQLILSDGWHKYFGFRIPPEKILCDGCLSVGGRLLDDACPVRPCVIEKGLANCSECGLYVCEKMKERIVDAGEMEAKLGIKIPAEDRRRFILPYENKSRLDKIIMDKK